MSGRKPTPHSSRKKSTIKQKIDFSIDEHDNTVLPNKNSLSSSVPNTCDVSTQTRIVSVEDPATKHKNKKLKTTPTNSEKSKNKNQHFIRIFGGQSCKGVAAELQLFLRKSYTNYNVIGITKPFANSEEILKGCNEKSINNDDKILINIGENDINPYKVIMELHSIIKQFPKNDIFILQATYNPHFNIDLLNYQFKLISQNFKNCHFIELQDRNRYNNISKIVYRIVKKYIPYTPSNNVVQRKLLKSSHAVMS